MNRIRIKNFGPIKEGYLENDGWIDVKKVTVFIGNQGSGKSTVAKLISTFMWMEKALNRGDITISTGNDIRKIIAWQRLDESYFGKNFYVEYMGERYRIEYSYKQGYPIIELLGGEEYVVPKIMYIPDQRNFLSSIETAFDVTGLPGSLGSLAQRVKKAQIELNGLRLVLPLSGFSYEYEAQTGQSYVVGKDHRTNLLFASSGLQSAIPLYLVSRNLCMQVTYENVPSTAPVSANQSIRRDSEISKIMQDHTLTSDEKIKKTDEVFARYHNKCFINVVEEPEQNLFPASQREILNSLVEINNESADNKLIITTHSPYLINDLTLAIEANDLLRKIKDTGNEENLNEMVYRIVPRDSTVSGNDVAIYEMDEVTGTISLLGNYKGLPSDENKLNEELGNGNDLFSELLEIESKLNQPNVDKRSKAKKNN